MRPLRCVPLACLLSLAFAGRVAAQATVQHIALANPHAIGVAFYQDASMARDYRASDWLYFPNGEEAAPDDWMLFAQADNEYFRFTRITITQTPGDGAGFEIVFQPLGQATTFGPSTFAILISGLHPANPDYQLSGVEVASTPFSSALLDLEVYTQPESLGMVGAFSGNITGTYFASYGILAITMATNTAAYVGAGTNLVITGTFSAIDTAAVPEPAVAALALALGSAGWIAWRRRGLRRLG